ncbi:hypothetical protein Q8F55_005069 [Vanrija albida]|uniref:Glycosyltransferase family 18 catalytic domain-containing protein n=1 Tax=Vanrija albida TaxID=181172 RepID=A0ABR3Q0L6_9TREE
MITRKPQPHTHAPLSGRRADSSSRFDLFRRRRVRLAICLVLAGLLSTLLLLPRGPPTAAARRTKDPACSGWDPLAAPSLDPPRCARARQLRQLQRFLDDPGWKYDAETVAALRRVERCVLGLSECPATPLIVSLYWFAYNGQRGGSAGEEVWMREVIDSTEAEGFVVVTGHTRASLLHLVRRLSLSIHMVWFNENNALECVSNPRCIRSEDYVEAADTFLRHEIAGIAPEEMGTLPLWKVFVTTYWGSRPSNADRPGFKMHRDWDVPETGGDEVWAFQPLGRRWQITPYPYPGHTWVPVSMERECLATPAPKTRTRRVVILGKRASYFQSRYAGVRWDVVQRRLGAADIELVAAMETDNATVPAGISNVGQLDQGAYSRLLSRSAALIGIGAPLISPGPYFALCRGVPVVMPLHQHDVPSSAGWDVYDEGHAQHGPVSALREPYVYAYHPNDSEGLALQVIQAVDHPIKPYVPPGYGAEDVEARVRAMLHYDYEGEYAAIVKANGGGVPGVPHYMLQKCWDWGDCFWGSYTQAYRGD